jgi:competence protein ComEC
VRLIAGDFPIKKMKSILTGLLQCCVLAVVVTTGVSNARAADAGKFTLTVLNLPDIQRGAGLALVLQTPGGKTYLYDTGNGYPTKTNASGWVADHNSGRDIVMPFLKQLKVTELDGIAISHAHMDHFGGLIWLSTNIPIKKLIDSGYIFPGQSSVDYSGELGEYNKIRERFKSHRAHQEAHTGDILDWDPRLKIEVMAPPKKYFTESNPESRPKADPPAHYLVNANSLGLRIQHGDIVFYLPGDIQSEDINQSLLPSIDKTKIKCHVLIAPGHGIHFTKEFAEATRPEVSIASVFPRYAKGLKSTPMLKAVGAKTYITGLNGQIKIVSDGTNYTVEAEHPDPVK